jgi:hypothetical protein
MTVKAKMNVDKWQQGRPEWFYDPTMQFWWRFVQCTLQDAMQVDPEGKPTDDALLARDWFAASKPVPEWNGRREFVSFDECCHWLGLNVDAERLALLELIDNHADFDTDDAWQRLEYLKAQEPEETEALFEVPEIFRIVPVRDQLSIFGVIQ